MTVIARATDLYRIHQHGERQEAVLRGIDLDIAEGEFVCVMGPSGSGKSTLLHLLAGLDQPSSGFVSLGDQRLDQVVEPARTLLRRRTIGHVFQFFHLLPNLSVIENVGLPIAIEGGHPEQHTEKLSGLLATLGLGGRENAMAHELSGGEMQRVSIARALAGGQPLLLCDEPTGNLSQKAGLEVMQILRRLRDEEGKSILLVTHNPRDATFADRVLFLVDGEVAKGVELNGPDIDVERVHETLAALAI
jgi:putative ABC transport system ATP-binding protein